ncbi:LOW QUALITY PROTEIN: hypothetical protein U9M48_026489, partial [Paspalum notatum var. saurae]
MATASRALLFSRAALSPLQASAASRRLPALLRPLAAAASLLPPPPAPSPSAGVRCFATQPATSSLRDSSPNWSNRPPKETILLDGCDFEHWLVVMEPPPGDAGNPDVTRDEIIDSYIKTLAQVVGSEEEARQKIYSVSTRHYFAFGALVSEELSYKLKELPKVRWVLPDSYLDVKNKDYGGEPFINGEAVPYDPKYHEEWVRNNARANERSRRNDRPKNFDRSRNFERRRENMQNYQNRDAQPGPGFNAPPPPPGPNQMPPRQGMQHGQSNMPPPPPPPHAAHRTISPKCQTHKQADTPLAVRLTTSKGVLLVTKADLPVDIKAITKVTKAQLTKVVTLATKARHLPTKEATPTHHHTKEATPTHHRTKEATLTHRHTKAAAILAMVAAQGTQVKEATRTTNEHSHKYMQVPPVPEYSSGKRWSTL